MREGARGFTLIEVVLSLTILAIAGTMIYAAFNAAADAWRRGQGHGRRLHVGTVAVERMTQQLRSLVPARMKRQGKRDVPAFAATESSLRFVTMLPSGSAVPAQVSYSIEEVEGESMLVYREHPWPDKDFFEGSEPRREERVPEIAALEVALEDASDVTGDGDPPEWSPDSGDFPARVRLRVVTAGADGAPGEAFEASVTLRTDGGSER